MCYVDPDKADAAFEHGMLTITMPKAHHAQSRRGQGQDHQGHGPGDLERSCKASPLPNQDHRGRVLGHRPRSLYMGKGFRYLERR